MQIRLDQRDELAFGSSSRLNNFQRPTSPSVYVEFVIDINILMSFIDYFAAGLPDSRGILI